MSRRESPGAAAPPDPKAAILAASAGRIVMQKADFVALLASADPDDRIELQHRANSLDILIEDR